MSGSLRSLAPSIRRAAVAIYSQGQRLNGRLVVTSARRNTVEQRRLYNDWKAGRSRIPAAPPGKSKHEHGLAFDMAVIGEDPFKSATLARLGRLWRSWGGVWNPGDPVHFEAPKRITARLSGGRRR